MRTYLIEAPVPYLVATQDEGRAAKRVHGHAWRPIELPDGKAAHLAAINALLEQVASSRPAPAPADPRPIEEARQAASRPIDEPVWAGELQVASSSSSWAANQLHSAAAIDRRQGNPADLGGQVDYACDLIGELGGYHLGNIAHAVAGRFLEIEHAAKQLSDAA